MIMLSGSLDRTQVKQMAVMNGESHIKRWGCERQLSFILLDTEHIDFLSELFSSRSKHCCLFLEVQMGNSEQYLCIAYLFRKCLA